MKFLLGAILCLALFSCEHRHSKVYKTTDKPGYAYQDDGLWYIYYLNANNTYTYYGTSPSFTNYDATTSVDWAPTATTVDNYSSMPEAATEAAESISESTGEATGGSESGVSESSGESSGGSDGGSDGGGGDGGGGD